MPGDVEVDDALREARSGDRDALGVLWRSHQPLVLRFLRGRGAPEPDDVASQVWIDVARNLHRFDGDATDFRRWLFTIARRRVLDDRRRTGRQPAAAVVPASEGGGAVAVTVGADEELDARDALARALGLVSGLPDRMRDVVLLRFVADLSVADTAAVVGIRAGHVRVLSHRALALLEAMLAGASDGPVTLAGRTSMKRST